MLEFNTATRHLYCLVATEVKNRRRAAVEVQKEAEEEGETKRSFLGGTGFFGVFGQVGFFPPKEGAAGSC
jgi:hypothetical protein